MLNGSPFIDWHVESFDEIFTLLLKRYNFAKIGKSCFLPHKVRPLALSCMDDVP